MIKDTALVSIIGVQELLWRADTSAGRRRQQLEALLVRGPRLLGPDASSSRSSRSGSSGAWRGPTPDARWRGRSSQPAGIEKYFGHHHVLRGVDLDVRQHETVMRHRPLRQRQDDAAALHQLPRGADRRAACASATSRVEADPLHARTGRTASASGQLRLRAGMVFQDFNLFPHMTVLQNCIEAPTHVKGMPRAQAVSTRRAIPGQGGPAGQARRVPGAPVGRPEAASGDRPRADHGAQGAAVRRAHERTRPGARRRGRCTVMEELAHEGIHDDRRLARDACSPARPPTGSSSWRAGSILEEGPPEQVLDAPLMEADAHRSCVASSASPSGATPAPEPTRKIVPLRSPRDRPAARQGWRRAWRPCRRG